MRQTSRLQLHDESSTDKRNPFVNANGKIYGSPEESTDLFPILDPVHNAAAEKRCRYGTRKHPHQRTIRWGRPPDHRNNRSIRTSLHAPASVSAPFAPIRPRVGVDQPHRVQNMRGEKAGTSTSSG
jgi:hypothetical protein